MTFTGSQINDIRVIGFGLVTLLLIVALVGLNFEAKVSYQTCVFIIELISPQLVAASSGVTDHTDCGHFGFSYWNIYSSRHRERGEVPRVYRL